MAPPLGLTRLSSKATPKPLRQASTCAAKASLISITSMSFSSRPARSSAFLAAGTGPKPMERGGTPATPVAITRTSGLTPALSPASRLATISAAAPSLMPDALPAVVTPSGNSALSLCKVSIVVSGRGCSSSLTTRSGLPLPWGSETGRI